MRRQTPTAELSPFLFVEVNLRRDIAKAVIETVVQTDHALLQAEEAQRATHQRELIKERNLLKAVAGEKSLRAYLTKLVNEAVDEIGKFPAPPPYKPPKISKGVTTE